MGGSTRHGPGETERGHRQDDKSRESSSELGSVEGLGVFVLDEKVRAREERSERFVQSVRDLTQYASLGRVEVAK